jgi:hypothetical protein
MLDLESPDCANVGPTLYVTEVHMVNFDSPIKAVRVAKRCLDNAKAGQVILSNLLGHVSSDCLVSGFSSGNILQFFVVNTTLSVERLELCSLVDKATKKKRRTYLRFAKD